MQRFLTLFLLLFLLSCTKPPPAPHGPVSSQGFTITRIDLGLEGFEGLSAADNDDTVIWIAPERQRMLLALDLHTHKKVAEYPIVGVPHGLDTEALAMLSHSSNGERGIVLGTESKMPFRKGDALLFGVLNTDRVEIQKTLSIEYALWNTKAQINRGIEGLCYVPMPNGHPGWLLAGIETVLESNGRRSAPLALVNMQDERTRPVYLELKSNTGKLSSLACQPDEAGEHLDLLAIERHYGVAHLLHAKISLSGANFPLELPSELIIDLTPVIPSNLNLEGIAYLPGGRLMLIGDNHTARRTGPNEAIILQPNPEKKGTVPWRAY